MIQGPVRAMGAGVVLMVYVEEVSLYAYIELYMYAMISELFKLIRGSPFLK